MSFEPFEQAMHERTEELLREELGEERFRALIEEAFRWAWLSLTSTQFGNAAEAVRLRFGWLVPRTQGCRAPPANGQNG